MVYSSKSVERYLSIFQEDCAKAGVKVHLKQLTRASRFQTTYGNRSFQLATQGFRGALDPSPEATWLSTLAGQKNNNNLAGLQHPRVDELCRNYEMAFDPRQRIAALREMDRIIFHEHPCILGWYSPSIRLIYWNKFGQPDEPLGRTAGPESALTTWWLDPHKERLLKAARRDSSRRLPVDPKLADGPHEIHHAAGG